MFIVIPMDFDQESYQIGKIDGKLSRLADDKKVRILEYEENFIEICEIDEDGEGHEIPRKLSND
jgi:hypothetical protein